MGEFKVQKNVPLPAAKRGHGSKYPFGDMEPGDSFCVPLEGKNPERVRNGVGPAASRFGKRHGSTWATRIVDDGIRVWRVS